MNICVYGSASDLIPKKYIKAVEELGEKIAQRGHSVVFGGGATGCMGATARGAKRANGEIIGIAPTFFNVDGVLFDECTELIGTETMRQRKQLLEEKSDAFIVTPGGIGTYDEFFEILTLKQLDRHAKPIVLFNVDGFFDKGMDFINKTIEEEFISRKTLELFELYDDPDKLLDHIENYKAPEFLIENMRNLKMK